MSKSKKHMRNALVLKRNSMANSSKFSSSTSIKIGILGVTDSENHHRLQDATLMREPILYNPNKGKPPVAFKRSVANNCANHQHSKNIDANNLSPNIKGKRSSLMLQCHNGQSDSHLEINQDDSRRKSIILPSIQMLLNSNKNSRSKPRPHLFWA